MVELPSMAVPGKSTRGAQRWGEKLSSRGNSTPQKHRYWPRGLTALTALTGAAFVIGFACSQLPQTESPSTQEKVASARKAAPKTAKKEQAPKPLNSYAEAIRRHQFERAAELLDSATQAEKSAPEVRYARALVALSLDDVETALRQVNGLEEDAPLFSAEARSVRLEAAKKSFDVTLLGHFLQDSSDIEEKLVLAEAHERSSSGQEARKIADAALSSLQKSKRRDKLKLQARAHELRARTLRTEDKPVEAAKEYHWLATHAAGLDPESSFEKAMKELNPKLSLTASERLARARTFSEKGWVKRTEEELEKRRQSGLPDTAESIHLQAWAIYISRTDYERAAEVFARAASKSSKDKQKNLYYEARSLARSHRDAEAIAKYEKVAKLSGGFTDHASYQAARLRFIDGQWKEAAQGYESYLKRFGRKSNHRQVALYDLPIARLAGGDYDKAAAELSSLIKEEESERKRVRLIQLRGVALLLAGKKDLAEELFRTTIRTRPLSFSALVAAARLVDMGKNMPPLIEPAKGSESSAVSAGAPLALSLPEKVWRLNRVGLDSQAERELRRHEKGIKTKFGKRGNEALCRLYGQLQSAQRRFQIAQYAARWSHLKFAPSVETSWEWECIYPAPYQDIARKEAQQRQVPLPFIYGVMRQESAFRPEVVSPAHAVGLMQIIPPTAIRIAGEIDQVYEADLMRAPAINIQFGAYYLRRLLNMFADRPELAAAAYNAGPAAVTRWLRAGEKLPLDVFVASIPYRETRNYVYRVMGNMARYAYRDEQSEVVIPSLAIPQGLKATDDAY